MKIRFGNHPLCQLGAIDTSNDTVCISMHPAPLLLMLLLFASHCLANDSIGYLSAGGIEFKKTEDISMEREVLTISRNLIRVEYDFLNKSSEPIRETIVFPMPFYGFDTGCSPQHSGELGGFKVWVDGIRLAPSRTVRARLKDRDVTNRLKELGFADEDIAEYRGVEGYCFTGPSPTGVVAKNLDSLAKEGLIDIVSNDGSIIVTPLWETTYFYSWNQEFPPIKKIHVVHEYVPFRSSTSGLYDFSQDFKQWGYDEETKNFCITEGAIRAGKRIQSQTTYGRLKIPAAGLVGESINYVLTTGANWAGPIKDFTLNLKKENANQLVSLCFDGQFVKQNPLTLSSRIKNFLPQEDISAIFFYPMPDGFTPSSGGYEPGYRRHRGR